MTTEEVKFPLIKTRFMFGYTIKMFIFI